MVLTFFFLFCSHCSFCLFCFHCRSDGDLHFDCVNLNSLSNWFIDEPTGNNKQKVIFKYMYV